MSRGKLVLLIVPYQSFANSHLTLPAFILKEISSLCGASLYCAGAQGVVERSF